MQRRDRAEGAALQLRGPLQILLDRVLRHRGAFHRRLELRREVGKALGDGGGRNRGKPEEHHVCEDFDLVGGVGETGDDALEEFVDVNSGEAGVELREK